MTVAYAHDLLCQRGVIGRVIRGFAGGDVIGFGRGQPNLLTIEIGDWTQARGVLSGIQ